MKAILFDEIGSPSEVLYLSDIEQPQIGENEVLIRMVGASITPPDLGQPRRGYRDPWG